MCPASPVLSAPMGLPVLGLSALVGLSELGEDVQTRVEGRGGPARAALVRTPVRRGGVGKIFQGSARPFWR